MQYILTEQEYRALTPISEVISSKKKYSFLMIKLWSLVNIHVEVAQIIEV